jgi:hypothetical protein
MTKLLAVLGILTITVAVAQAEWTTPSNEQILQAAQDPSKLAALLQGANDGQAATVVTRVLQAATTLGLSAADLSSRAGQIVTAGMQNRTEAGTSAIATAVGRVTAATPALGAIVPSIAQSVQLAGGASALLAFNSAVAAGSGASGGNPDQSPLYDNLR